MKMIIFIVTYFFIYGTINPTTAEFTQIQILVFPIYIGYLLLKKELRFFKTKIFFKIFLFVVIMFFYHFFIKFLNSENLLLSGPFFQLWIKIIIKFSNAIVLFLLIKKVKHNKNEQIEFLFKNIIFAIFLDLNIGILRYIFPKINDFLFLLNKPTVVQEYFIENRLRLIGYGTSFFPAGIISSIGLFLIVFLQNRKEKYRYWLIYIFVLFTGLFTARTIIIGCLLSLFYYLENKKFLERFLKLLIVLIFIISTISLLFVNINKENNKVFKWAFEFFLKRGETGSTNVLKKMWRIIPDQLNTWIFGDGKWVLETGGYYMKTDVVI